MLLCALPTSPTSNSASKPVFSTGLPTALARAEAGQRIDDLLDEIAELQRMIDASPAETLEEAAVKLRRLGAYVERGQPARLLAGALGAVERAVEAGQLPARPAERQLGAVSGGVGRRDRQTFGCPLHC